MLLAPILDRRSDTIWGLFFELKRRCIQAVFGPKIAQIRKFEKQAWPSPQMSRLKVLCSY